MTFTECADGVTCSCSVCYNTVVITKDANSSSVSQLREMLASVFERCVCDCVSFFADTESYDWLQLTDILMLKA